MSRRRHGPQGPGPGGNRELREFQQWLDKARREMFPKLAASDTFLSLCPEGEPDAKFCLELGAAIMFDKPIVVVAVEGREVPPGLLRIAHHVIEADTPEEAGEKVAAYVAQQGDGDG